MAMGGCRKKSHHGNKSSRAKHPRAEAGPWDHQYRQEPGSPRPRDLSEAPRRGGQMYRGEKALEWKASLLGTYLSQKVGDHIVPFGHTGVGQGVDSSQLGEWHLAQGFPVCHFIISVNYGTQRYTLFPSCFLSKEECPFSTQTMMGLL